ncbi:class IV adenylate cyclase [Halobium palmae]|uniref:Class IV adenylate cyclase n=1 Tax=Halobium palmae TaxID=1776492 RepID=A0ABD5RYZ4_9EURY
MYEVELKVRADLDRVRDRLDELDAEGRGSVEQRDTYYDAPHREFAETDEALRIRRERTSPTRDDRSREGGKAEETARVTYKGPLVDDASKTREEHETAVGDDGEAAEILRGLGFKPAAAVEKRRTIYDLDGYTVVLDDVTDLGEFVEVEREVSEGAVDEAREGAVDVLRSLGLDPDDGIRTSYLGLLLARADQPDD